MAQSISINTDCGMMPYTREVVDKCSNFSCGNKDLDDFFANDVFLYADEMLGNTYCWVTKSVPHKIVAIVTLANDSIKSSQLPKMSRNRFNRQFDNQKRNKTYPSTLIGRLGVNDEFQGQHIGHQVMEYIKYSNISDDRENACRFLVVDAYNSPDTLAYYEHNGFVYMHKSEEIERLALKRYDEDGNLIFEIPNDEPLHTRMMYFDLKKL